MNCRVGRELHRGSLGEKRFECLSARRAKVNPRGERPGEVIGHENPFGHLVATVAMGSTVGAPFHTPTDDGY
jgi:hypothetical protein